MTLREKGYKILYQPNSRIGHKLSHSGSGAHPFHSHNTSYFMNKWVASGRIDRLVQDKRPSPLPEVKNVLVKRQGAKGDVLLASGVLAALKKKYPDCNITFCTKCPEVLRNHPHIHRIIENDHGLERTFQLYGNLDLAYEYRPYTSVLESYCDVLGVQPSDCEFFVDTQEVTVPEKYVVLHAGKTGGNWVGREWTYDHFNTIAKKLIDRGEKVVCVGSDSDFTMTHTMDYRARTTLAQLAYIIKKAKLFVGIDSLPLQICQAMNVPGVAFFGSITPKYRIFRDNVTPVIAEGLDCLGCHHRQLPPATVINRCEKGDSACVARVSVNQMWSTIVNKL
jgi:ADP-heptose:LPS heptosyltransferase